MESNGSRKSYNDFFEEEDFAAPPVSKETLKSIHNDMRAMRDVLPDILEWSVMNRGKLDVADLGSSMMLSFRLGKHENPNMLPSIELFKKDSAEYEEEKHVGDIVFFLSNDPGRHVLFEVFAHKIRKRNRFLFAGGIGLDEDTSNALLRIFREMAEMLKREQDTEDLLEETGIDFVSEVTAQFLKLVTENFKEYVLSYYGG